jgi:hypothetical protein
MLEYSETSAWCEWATTTVLAESPRWTLLFGTPNTRLNAGRTTLLSLSPRVRSTLRRLWGPTGFSGRKVLPLLEGSCQFPVCTLTAHNRDLGRTALLRLALNLSKWFRKQCGVIGDLARVSTGASPPTSPNQPTTCQSGDSDCYRVADNRLEVVPRVGIRFDLIRFPRFV